MRLRRGWTQRQLASHADVGRLVIGRIERGEGPLDVETLDRLGVALGVPLAVRFDRDIHEAPADAGHLEIQELILRIGRHGGYETGLELATRPNDPWRSIDVVLSLPRLRRAVACECWNTFGDIGAAVRASQRKRAELDQLVAGRWGEGAQAGLVWVVRDTARNRELMRRYQETFSTAFPGSSQGWVTALTTGSEPPAEPGLVWADTSTGRLHAWHRVRGSGS